MMLLKSMDAAAQALGSGGWEVSCPEELSSSLNCTECEGVLSLWRVSKNSLWWVDLCCLNSLKRTSTSQNNKLHTHSHTQLLVFDYYIVRIRSKSWSGQTLLRMPEWTYKYSSHTSFHLAPDASGAFQSPKGMRSHSYSTLGEMNTVEDLDFHPCPRYRTIKSHLVSPVYVEWVEISVLSFFSELYSQFSTSLFHLFSDTL